MSQHEQNRTDVDPEELQPCLDYGKKAYEAIMKADIPEAAAAIEGHCTFVPGSSVWVVEKVWKKCGKTCKASPKMDKNGACSFESDSFPIFLSSENGQLIYIYILL